MKYFINDKHLSDMVTLLFRSRIKDNKKLRVEFLYKK